MNTPIPNTQETIDFLNQWFKEGICPLTAIKPDVRNSIETVTFASSKQAIMWINSHQGNANLYFMINPAKAPLQKKGTKSDVWVVKCLHVDIDPPAGVPLKQAQEAILARLNNFPIPPSIIVFTGGGYQAYWLLIEEILVRDLKHAEEIESYNKKLAEQLGGDNCHNIDRILRLPGTINVPDEKKRKKGREAATAYIVKADFSLRYHLESFSKSVQTPSHMTATPLTSSAVSLVDSLDSLPDDVTNRIKNVILHGTDLKDPARYPSRSEALFGVCCALAKAGCDEGTIKGIILNPAFKISESVLDKAPKSEQYAERQVRRAVEFNIHPKLAELNAEFTVISDDGGKCRVISRFMDEGLNRFLISHQSFEDFKKRFCHLSIEVGQTPKGLPITMPLGDWWLKNPLRNQLERIVFAPGKQVKNVYNLWQGLAFEPIAGDKHLSFLGHIKTNICGSDEIVYEYFEKWMARVVQQPSTPGEVSIVLRGQQGTGKGFFAKHFGALLGQHFLQVTNTQHLVGKFNAHLEDCVLLFADEAFYAGDKKHEAILKGLVTEERIMVERKGVDAIQAPNYLHIIMASNSEWVVPSADLQRRFLVLDVSSSKIQDSEFFESIAQDLKNGGYENLLHHLLNIDLVRWNHRKFPSTQATKDQRYLSTTPFECWLIEMLISGVTPGYDIQKQDTPALICLECCTKEIGMSTYALRRALIQRGVIEDKPIERRVFQNLDGTIVLKKGRKPGAKEVGKFVYPIRPLDGLRQKLQNLMYGKWPEDGNKWRLTDETPKSEEAIPSKETLPF